MLPSVDGTLICRKTGAVQAIGIAPLPYINGLRNIECCLRASQILNPSGGPLQD
jgi:hypothetical protein